ncbi:hypothetical protein [Mesorhizobium sp. B4-1-4]|uniref:hypothetical protein n=1 Tax=Mesorhizobium sp. B4-1-4 TaxID=2589888 RepID=UPI00112E67B4|nr:hypothetical protein [Mesorhizobium sp. B4-1-4]UCI32532.1 hypothetical protein FJW03_03495 [Mesorhizobium sp. B4-1-4]
MTATPAAACNSMFSNTDFFGPEIDVTDDQHDRDLAAWQLGRTVRMITNFDCSDGSCIEEPMKLWHEVLELIPDLDRELVLQARLLMLACITLERDRAAGA